jgi:hypothetical protein
VNDRLAVDFEDLKLPISLNESIAILSTYHIEVSFLNIVEIARSRIGNSIYKRGAAFDQWPGQLDCSGLTKWVYGQMGIWIPRYSIDQLSYADENLSYPRVGDLVFTSGRRNYYLDDPAMGIGHVGMMISDNSIVHAANSKIGVVETYTEKFANAENFRGVGRVVEDFSKLHTLALPEKSAIETSADIRWKILQRLK